MKSFLGVPAHPLLVHLPAVLLPLAAIGVLVMVIKPAWHQRYRWVVLALGLVGTAGAVLAASAGEDLAEQIVAKRGSGAAERWDDHVGFGESARLYSIVFAVVLLLFVLVPWYLERREGQDRRIAMPTSVLRVLAGVALLASAGSVYTVVQAGHSGAKAVWCDVNSPPNCGG